MRRRTAASPFPLYYDLFPTEVGWVAALASPKGLRNLTVRRTPQEALDGLGPDLTGAVEDQDALATIRVRVNAYLWGDDGALIDIPLDLQDAPPFFRAAWEACRRIPLGETRSYAWLAVEAGRPGAFRAAGQAMARNRLALIIPCHRVIGSDGDLHGYAGGTEKKARLLTREREKTWS